MHIWYIIYIVCIESSLSKSIPFTTMSFHDFACLNIGFLNLLQYFKGLMIRDSRNNNSLVQNVYEHCTIGLLRFYFHNELSFRNPTGVTHTCSWKHWYSIFVFFVILQTEIHWYNFKVVLLNPPIRIWTILVKSMTSWRKQIHKKQKLKNTFSSNKIKYCLNILFINIYTNIN